MKIVSLNIEKREHLDTVKEFLQQEKPDVVCLQELCQQDIALFAELTDMSYIYTPMFRRTDTKNVIGVGLFAKDITEHSIHWIGGSEEDSLPERSPDASEEKYLNTIFQLLLAKVKVADKLFTIGTTHLPDTENGEVTDYQMEIIKRMLDCTKHEKDLILTGDFNAPRGREGFAEIAKHYQDNIPLSYETTIDENLHHAGYLPYVVDGLFSTPHYQVKEVSLQDGVSDHLAIVAEVDTV